MPTDRAALERSWEVTRGHLDAARLQLIGNLSPGAEGATMESYEHFLGHNELELALGELADLGCTNVVSSAFWKCLSRAAENMGLLDRVSLYEEQLQKHGA